MDKKLTESLLLTKPQLKSKLQELKNDFPEKFEGINDEDILNNLKDIVIDYLDGCADLRFKEGDKEDKIIDITGNSTHILEEPAYKTLMSKFFEEIVDTWLVQHNLTHKDIVNFRYDCDTQQIFVTFDINNDEAKIADVQDDITEKPVEIEEDFSEADEALEYDALNKYEKELIDILTGEQISFEDLYIEEQDVDGVDDCLVITVSIDGDWKHDHQYCTWLIKQWAVKKGFELLDHDSDVTREDGSDDYGAIHYYTLKARDENVPLEETYSDEELDKMIGKTYNLQKIQTIYRRQKYNDSRLFAHTKCINCGREKRVFLSNLINDPEKYGSCTCSDTNVESRLDNIEDLFDGTKKLSNNTSGYTGVSYIKTYKGQLYDKWRAYIEIDGKRTYLGDFDSKSAAIKARKKAAEKGLKWYKEHKNEFMKNYRKKSKRYRRTRRGNRK